MINKIDSKNNGFTLIELMIVMIILGILATIGFTSFQNSQKKGRDARRKNDLQQIALALETYYNDFANYPAQDGTIPTNYRLKGCGATASPVLCDWGSVFKHSTGLTYMLKLPKDPKGNWNYNYRIFGVGFQIYARLENTDDPDVPVSGSVIQNYGISCGEKNCNYGISSTNINPTDGRTLAND